MAAFWRIPASGIASAGLLTLAPISLAHAERLDAQPAAVPVIAEAAETPASVVALDVNDTDRMTIPIRIASQGPFAFIIDTAATRTVISRDLATTLNLKPAGKVNMVSLTGSNNAMMVHIPDLTFRPGKTHDVKAIALGDTYLGAHGILGIDTLRNQRVVLDFKARTLAVIEAPRRWPDKVLPGEIVVTARRKLGQLILADSTIDGDKVDVIVDTGTQVSLGNEALRRRLLSGGSRYKTTPISLIGVTGGVLNADYTRVDKLRIGSVQMTGMPIAFADAYPFRKLKLRKPALLLGMDALGMFARVTLDFANRKASFVLPDPVTQAPISPGTASARPPLP